MLRKNLSKIAELNIQIESSWIKLSVDYCRRGYLYLEDGQYKQALDDANKAIDAAWISINTFRARALRGAANYYLGNLDDAIIDLEKTVYLNEQDTFVEDTEASYNAFILGCAYQKKNILSKAIINFVKTYQLDNEHQKALMKLHQIFLELEPNVDLTKIDKSTILKIIQNFEIADQKKLLRHCLDKNTSLGARMWEKEGLYKCCYESGKLKEICDRLEKIDSTFQRPVTPKHAMQNSIFSIFSDKKKLANDDEVELREVSNLEL